MNIKLNKNETLSIQFSMPLNAGDKDFESVELHISSHGDMFLYSKTQKIPVGIDHSGYFYFLGSRVSHPPLS